MVETYYSDNAKRVHDYNRKNKSLLKDYKASNRETIKIRIAHGNGWPNKLSIHKNDSTFNFNLNN